MSRGCPCWESHNGFRLLHWEKVSVMVLYSPCNNSHLLDNINLHDNSSSLTTASPWQQHLPDNSYLHDNSISLITSISMTTASPWLATSMTTAMCLTTAISITTAALTTAISCHSDNSHQQSLWQQPLTIALTTAINRHINIKTHTWCT